MIGSVLLEGSEAVKDLRVALFASARGHELGCLRLMGDRKKNKKQVSGTNKFTALSRNL